MNTYLAGVTPIPRRPYDCPQRVEDCSSAQWFMAYHRANGRSPVAARDTTCPACLAEVDGHLAALDALKTMEAVG